MMNEQLELLPTDDELIFAAKNLWESEGTLEIDDNPIVSRGFEEGAYIQAWIWVSFDDVECYRRTKHGET